MRKKLSLNKLVNLSMPSNDVYSYVVGDIPGFFISYIILKYTRLSANLITYCSLMLGICSVLLICTWGVRWGCLVYYLAFVLDFVDGKVARFRGTASPRGKVLDLVVDRVIFVFMILAFIYSFMAAGFLSLGRMLFLISCGLFLIQDSFTMVSVIEKYYSGIAYRPSNVKNNLKFMDKFIGFKNWVPRNVTIVFSILVVSPIANFNHYFLCALIVIQATHFIKDIYRFYHARHI
jgi:phosphatidylserine synthase